MRVLRSERFGDRLVGVRYGALGRSLLLRCVPWNLWRWGLAQESPTECGDVLSGDLSLRALACVFVPGGAAFLRANGLWPADADLPPPPADRADLERLAPFGSADTFLPYIFHSGGRAYLAWRYCDHSATEPALFDMAGEQLVTYAWQAPHPMGAACFSGDGELLAIANHGHRVRLFHGASGEAAGELEHTGTVVRLAFCPGRRLLVTLAGKTVRLWDAAGRRCLVRFRAFRSFTEALAFSPDGRLLAAGAREGRVRVWEVASGRELADHDWALGAVHDLAFAPDGLTAAGACFEQAFVWDVDV